MDPSAPTLVALDTEGASVSGPPHLIEVAGVRFRAGEALEHFQALIRPEIPIEPAASDVHGLEDADVRAAQDAPSVLAAFAAWLGDDALVAHDARADGWALGFSYARLRLAPPPGVLLDSLALARRVFPHLADHRLATIAEHLGLDTDGLHRSLVDATLAWQVVEACVAELGGWPAVDLERLVALAGHRATIGGCAPGRPGRRPSLVRALERAAAAEEEVRLVYGAPDAPPATLAVRPRWLYQVQRRGYLEAECVASGTLKTYRLDRVQKLLTGSRGWNRR